MRAGSGILGFINANAIRVETSEQGYVNGYRFPVHSNNLDRGFYKNYRNVSHSMILYFDARRGEREVNGTWVGARHANYVYHYKGVSYEMFMEFITARHFTKQHIISLLGGSGVRV